MSSASSVPGPNPPELSHQKAVTPPPWQSEAAGAFLAMQPHLYVQVRGRDCFRPLINGGPQWRFPVGTAQARLGLGSEHA